MTIQLSFLTDFRRVRISLSNLLDGSVRLERALNPAATDPMWSVVRGGRSLAVVDGVAELDDYEWVSDVDNWYRVVPVDPPAGLFLPGQSGAYASTPDHASLDITGDIDIRAHLTVSSWQAASARTIAAKWGSGLSWIFYITGAGELGFAWDPDGTGINTEFAETSAPLSDLSTAVRVTLDVDNAGDYTVTFYTASSMSGLWQEFETVNGSGTTQINASNAALEVGSRNGGTIQRLDGVVHALQVRDGIDGTPVADVNFGAQDNGDTQFTDDSGLTWTVHGDARIVGVEMDSITPSLDGEVWLRSVTYPHLARPVNVLRWGDITREGRNSINEIAGRSLPVGVTDVAGSPQFPVTLVTGDVFDRSVDGVAEAATLSLILALGGVFHLHVPPERTFPGGYFLVDRVVQDRIVRAGDRAPRVFDMVIRLVARPDPDVTGTTITWGTVERRWGSWEALLAEHPTTASLLAVVGDPEDLVEI